MTSRWGFLVETWELSPLYPNQASLRMLVAMLTKLRIKATLEEPPPAAAGKDNHLVLSFLESLKEASKDLQNIPIFARNDPQITIEGLLELENKAAGTVLSTNPNLFKLSQLLCALKKLLENLKRSQSYSLKSLLGRQFIKYEIYRLGFTLNDEIQACIDRECVQNLVKTLKDVDFDEEEKVKVLKEFEQRLSQGFDRDFQELVLRGKVFSILQFLLCESTCSRRIKEHSALAIVGLVRFNKDVFVGLVLMHPIVQALTSMASSCTIQVLCSLIRLIKIPLIDEIELDGEIPRIISLLSSEHLSIRVAAMDCICEIAYFGRIEVIEDMVEQGLIEKLVGLQRSRHEGSLIDADQCNENRLVCEEGVELDRKWEREEERNETMENWAFASCVARFAVQVEVGEGLSITEKAELKGEILGRIRKFSVSEAETATIVAEVLWGSSN